jgi:hypothetical protein
MNTADIQIEEGWAVPMYNHLLSSALNVFPPHLLETPTKNIATGFQSNTLETTLLRRITKENKT